MKFHVTPVTGENIFTGYGNGYVTVNHQRFERPVIVSSREAAREWDAPSFEALTSVHFQALLELEPEIVLLGTGTTIRFPKPELTRAFIQARVGFEVMDTKAACRTYNILTAEGRQVVAAILI
jgi:uncharacterized protein